MRTSRVCCGLAAFALLGATFLAGAAPASASAAPLVTPTGVKYHRITFPVAGKVTYTDDFGACREGCTRVHQGNDLLGAKLMHEVAATDGVIEFLHGANSGTEGNMLSLRGNDGWDYWYIHINNDTPGTDDGANPGKWRFARGIAVGTHVKAGQFIAYMGDSGDAENTQPHLHFEMHLPNGTPIDPYTSLKLAQGIGVNGVCGLPSNPRAHASSAAGRGYWIVSDDGVVRTFGAAQTFTARASANPVIWTWSVVGMAPTPSGRGYWLTDREGHVVPFGDARSYGGTQNLDLTEPIIGMTATVTGKGYWLLAKDGGIFSFGDAKFFGSMGTRKLNAPIVGMAATPGGRGYWLLGRDGGIFSFGNAHFWGSTGAMKLDKPVLSMAATATGKGYWLVGGDGGMFTFGDAAYRGSLPGTGRCNTRAVAMAGTKTGGGYWLLEPNGKVDAFGDAMKYGDATGVFPLGLVAVP